MKIQYITIIVLLVLLIILFMCGAYLTDNNSHSVRTPITKQERRRSVGVRGFACKAGVSGWRLGTPSGLSGEDLSSKDNGVIIEGNRNRFTNAFRKAQNFGAKFSRNIIAKVLPVNIPRLDHYIAMNERAVSSKIPFANAKIIELQNANDKNQDTITNTQNIIAVSNAYNMQSQPKLQSIINNSTEKNDENQRHIRDTKNNIQTLNQNINTLNRLSRKDVFSFVKVRPIVNQSNRVLRDVNTRQGKTSIDIYNANAPSPVTDNTGIFPGTTIAGIKKNGFTTISESFVESLTLAPDTTIPAIKAITEMIELFATNGISIAKEDYGILNNEMFKYKNEKGLANDEYENRIIQNYINPLVKNRILDSNALKNAINKLATMENGAYIYGYNPVHSIFVYIQLFNKLNITLDPTEFNNVVAQYAKYGVIPNLELFLKNCIYLKMKENDHTYTILSYKTFMDMHKENGLVIASNTLFNSYVKDKLQKFYKTRYYTEKQQKDKYLTFLKTVNSFHPENKTVNLNAEGNKIDEFIATLQTNGIRTYQQYASVFVYKNDNEIQIKEGIVKITTMRMFEFIQLFKTYYNDYKCNSSKETEITNFKNKYSWLSDNIPNVSFTTAIQRFLQTFKSVEFTKDGCFGYFIQSLKNQHKYITNLLDENPVDTSNPILFKYYIEENSSDGFDVLDNLTDEDEETNMHEEHNNPLYWLYNQFAQLFFGKRESAKTMRDGYLQALRKLNVTNVNEISINPTDKPLTEMQFISKMVEYIPSMNMVQLTVLLDFLGTISMDITEVDSMMKLVKEFGVSSVNIEIFTKRLASFQLGSSSNFIRFLQQMVLLKVNIDSFQDFTNDLTHFSKTTGKDEPTSENNTENVRTPERRRSEGVRGITEEDLSSNDIDAVDMLNNTLNIFIDYHINYEYGPYDTSNRRLSNCIYNLTLDKINMKLFSTFSVEFLKTLNRGVDLYRPRTTNAGVSVDISDTPQLYKNLRDIIIRRENLLYTNNDTTALGKYYNTKTPYTDITTLRVFPQRMYNRLLHITQPATIQYELDINDPTVETPMFNKQVINTMTSDDPYFSIKDTKFTKRYFFYKYIISQNTLESSKYNPFDYCMIANLLTVNEYDQMLRTDGTVLVIRSVMSRLLNKLLIKHAEIKQKTTDSTGNATPVITQYNSYVDTINMIRIFPYYSFYLIAKHIRENNPRENDPTKCGHPKYRAHDKTIDPYVVELSTINTPDPTQYSYTENYKGFGMNDNLPKESFAFYNATNPYVSSSQYASW